MLQNKPAIKSLIDQLWNSFWSGGLSNPITAIEQISYLLFMKRLDEMDADRAESRFLGEWTTKVEVSGIEAVEEIKKQELRWSIFTKLKPEAMLAHIHKWVFPFLKSLNGKESPFTKHMASAVFLIPQPRLLANAVALIDKIFVEIKKDKDEGGQSFQDIQGDVYEMLLNEIARSGKNGQFRTPRHIIKFMADLTRPMLHERIGDPACGTSGFLLGAFQFIVTDLSREKVPDKIQADEDGFERAERILLLTADERKSFEKNLIGFDFDPTMVRLGIMNLIMHGIDEPCIENMDSLSLQFDRPENTGTFDLVLANPPFTGSIDKGDVSDALSLKNQTTKTELLFLERILKMLKPGGRAAVIVPQGVLFGAGRAFVETRKMLLENAKLDAVITLPSGVFKPYAGVSTAILLFEKGGSTGQVWFFEVKSDGYSLDDKRTKRDETDLPEAALRYLARNSATDTDRTVQGFFVPKTEIAENGYTLALNRYKIELHEEPDFEPTSLILEKLETIENLIASELVDLKKLVG